MGTGLNPSQHSLDYRAGHAPEWKRSTYYLSGIDEGDYEIGRTFIGTIGTKEHSALPPHFIHGESFPGRTAQLVTACQTCFPWYDTQPVGFQACLLRFLASLVHHSAWILEKHEDHPVLATALFQEEGLLEKLKSFLGDVHGNGMLRKGINFLGKVRTSGYFDETTLSYFFYFLAIKNSRGQNRWSRRKLHFSPPENGHSRRETRNSC